MINCLKFFSLCIVSAIYISFASIAYSESVAPYTEEAEKKIEDALARVDQPRNQKTATPEMRMKTSLEIIRSAYSAAGYDYDATIVQIADDMRNHPERIPKNRVKITTVNHVIAGIHVMMSECEHQNVNCLKFFSNDAVEAIKYLERNTKFSM